MQRSCERAVDLGLPSIAFTEHLDFTVWTANLEAVAALPLDHPVAVLSDPQGQVSPPLFDAAGYLEAVERCRSQFRSLRILSGVELGEPHRHAESTRAVLESGTFDRVLGSLHCLPEKDGFQEPNDLYSHRDPDEIVRQYLVEVADMVSAMDTFSVLAHIDYPARSWPVRGEPFDAYRFEDEFRHALRATARSGKALEINTVVPLPGPVLHWWHQEGGQAVSFGSDAHEPSRIAQGFADAAAMAEANGFRAARDPVALWNRG